MQSDFRTIKKRRHRHRHRHRRICGNCEQILDRLTIKCPRCDRLTPTPVHLLAFTTAATVAVVALFKSLDLL